ncbi:MAG: hypothetical protein IKZ96_02235 [Bacilli bacterium]|nr:hypothetical protein [Bacilli bacterium]
MKKILSSIKEFLIKHKLIVLITLGVILVIIALLVIFGKTSVNKVKRVSKVLSNSYYKVECMNDDCDYIIAYKGDIVGKTKIKILDSKGKKIASYNEKLNINNMIIRNIIAVNKNYIIFSKTDAENNKSGGYSLARINGKEIYNTDYKLAALNESLLTEKLDETYNILNKNGKVLYTNVKDIKGYNDNKILSASIKNENYILNEKGETILNGYSIVKGVKDDEDNTLYLILQDSGKNAYYYYDINSNKIVGDAFNSYTNGSNTGELIITKKNNTDYVKYILKANGKATKLSSVSSDDLKSIDTEKYTIMYDSYIIKEQTAVLVSSKSENSFGVYNLKTNKYTKLFDGSASSLSKLLSNEKELYVGINYNSENGNIMYIYDLVNDKKVYELNSKDFSIQYYTNYGDYNVVKYSSSSSEDYKNKYAVYDKNNKEIYRSDNQIVVVDKEYVFGKEPISSQLILFSAKKNKVLNTEETLATKVSIGKSYFYKFSDNEKTYLYNYKGEKLKTINIASVSFIYSNDTIIYIYNNKVYIVNPTDNRTTTYKLKANERLNANDGELLAPYKNTLYINNPVNNYSKVVNVNGLTLRKMRKSTIESVNYNKKTKNVIIVTKKVKKNNNLYGLYIGK